VTDPERFRYLNGLLTTLARGGHVDVLRAVRDGTLTLLDLAGADALGRLRFALADRLEAERAAQASAEAAAAPLPPDPLDRPLWATALDEVIPGMDYESCGPETKGRYATSIKSLRDREVDFLPPSATFRDLLKVDWKTLKTEWNRSAADWNHLRRALSAVLTTLLGFPSHEFRERLMQLVPLRRERARVPRITPELFWQIYDCMPEHARIAIVVLAATGLRVGEYGRLERADLFPERFELHVPGTKTEGSDDLIAVDPGTGRSSMLACPHHSATSGSARTGYARASRSGWVSWS
jgi:integrase